MKNENFHFEQLQEAAVNLGVRRRRDKMEGLDPAVLMEHDV